MKPWSLEEKANPILKFTCTTSVSFSIWNKMIATNTVARCGENALGENIQGSTSEQNRVVWEIIRTWNETELYLNHE